MQIRTLCVALVAIGAVLLAGCSKDSDDKSSGATTTTTIDLKAYDFTDLTGESTVEIKAVDNNFEPQYAKVSKGTTVNFKNDGRNNHNVISVETGAFKDIDTAAFEPGTTVAVSFPKAGVYQFYCSLHGTPTKGMNGIIQVV